MFHVLNDIKQMGCLVSSHSDEITNLLTDLLCYFHFLQQVGDMFFKSSVVI